MSNHKHNSVGRFAGRGFRCGMAKDQLIFIIICSAALLVAAVTLVHYFTGTSEKDIKTWQCLKCSYKFTKKTSEYPPIECPKCGGDAAGTVYRDCPECGKRVLCYRLRLSAQVQAQRDAMMKQAESSGQPASMGPMMNPDMDIQYWIKQADGSYGWTDWMNIMASPQQVQELQKTLRCSECDALLFTSSSR